MRHWTLIGEAPLPGAAIGRERSLHLYRGKDDYAIKISGGHELMNTRMHGSEDALGRLPCERIATREGARVLIGGLGMGFTLAAALAVLRQDGEAVVAELIPEVVDWNRGELGDRSGRPLDDPRTTVHIGDVGELIRQSPRGFDAIALDVDNGPEGLTQDDNDWLYDARGIAAVQAALRPKGVVAWWSAGPDKTFEAQLRRTGFRVQSHTVRAHGNKGPRHVIWLCST
ncbi:MAG: hypothetical protein AAGA95_02305 [Pseudomonadota bacterium]